MGCVILNLSTACARNYHFLGQTVIFEGWESFLTWYQIEMCTNKNQAHLCKTEYFKFKHSRILKYQ